MYGCGNGKVNSFTHSRFSIRQVSRNKELKQRLDEQSLQQKEMLREIDDLRQQLQNTQQALNNEIYRKPKPSIVNRYVCQIFEFSIAFLLFGAVSVRYHIL